MPSREKVPIGELRHIVTFQARTEVDDGHGGFEESWAAVKSRIPARVRPLSGRELEIARQVDPRISHEVTVRYWRAYPTDLDGGRARMVYHDVTDRSFEIIGPPVDVDEKHERLVMMCTELQ